VPLRSIAPESSGFIVLLGAVAMLTSLALDMSLPALPTLAAEFNASPDTVQLTLSFFFIGYAGGQLFYGPLSDRFGRRPVLLAGLGLFTLAGFLSAASWSLDMLVALRFVHGVSAASGPVIARAVVRDHFGGARAAQSLSAVLAVMSIAPLIAPFIGGLLLTAFGWRAIFVLLGLLGLTLLIAVLTRLDESLKLPDPQALHPLRLLANYRAFFRSRISLGFTLVNAVAFAALFTYISGSPFVLIEVYGLGGTQFGLLFGLSAGGFMLGSIANNRLVRRLRIGGMLRLGFSLAVAASLVLLLCAWLRLGGPWGIILPFAVVIFALAVIMPNATAAAMEPLPHMAGTAAAILGATQMAVGSLAGYIVNRLYDHSPIPMAAMIVASTVAALALYLVLIPRKAA
jgi:MFS transporter, DHA1 family, multidrug resistance protein